MDFYGEHVSILYTLILAHYVLYCYVDLSFSLSFNSQAGTPGVWDKETTDQLCCGGR